MAAARQFDKALSILVVLARPHGCLRSAGEVGAVPGVRERQCHRRVATHRHCPRGTVVRGVSIMAGDLRRGLLR